MAPMSLHGRREILTDVTEITDDNVIDVLNKALRIHAKNRAEEKYLQKYERGIQPILDRKKAYNDYVCNRVVVNIANQINTFKTAEFAGEPIQYVSRSSKKAVPKKIEKLNAMMISEGKRSKDYDLARKMFCNGVGYRLILNDSAEAVAKKELLDEAPFEIYIPDPKNTFVVKVNNVRKKVIMGVTYVFLDENQNRVRYSVYTDNVLYTIDGTPMSASRIVGTPVRHNFGMVPLVEYPCNNIFMGAFEVVLPLLDAYNLVMSDRLDGIEQFIQALMVFEGVDITREDFLELKDLGAIKLPPSIDGRQSRVYYLSEQLDQGQTQTLVDDMYQTILQIVGMPSQGSGNTADSSNNGAVILKNGWWNAEARALETEASWIEAETQTLKIILKICEDANVLTGLSVSDVEPKFGRRSYEDKLTKVQSFTTMLAAGTPPIQAYAVSNIMTDPEAGAMAYEAYQEQKKLEQEDDLMNEVNRARTAIVQSEEGNGAEDENL
jgi:SPP1 family phage portal protein